MGLMAQYVSRPCAKKNDACLDVTAWMPDRYPWMKLYFEPVSSSYSVWHGRHRTGVWRQDLGIDACGGLGGIYVWAKAGMRMLAVMRYE